MDRIDLSEVDLPDSAVHRFPLPMNSIWIGGVIGGRHAFNGHRLHFMFDVPVHERVQPNIGPVDLAERPGEQRQMAKPRQRDEHLDQRRKEEHVVLVQQALQLVVLGQSFL